VNLALQIIHKACQLHCEQLTDNFVRVICSHDTGITFCNRYGNACKG